MRVIILFVEGDSDKEFFEALYQYYQKHSKSQLKAVLKVCNIKGIGRYESKIPSKLKNHYLPKIKTKGTSVFCSYDTDVFDLAEKPPTDWESVKKKVNDIGIDKFYEIPVSKMIEDWFLLDISGLCKYLKIKEPSRLVGNSGYTKIKDLFKKGNKVYQKGSDCHKFVSSLNIELIRKKISNQLKLLENELGIRL